MLSIHIHLHAPRRNTVHPDLPIAHIERQTTHEGLDRRLGTGIQYVVLDRARLCGNRGQHYETPADAEVLVGLLRDEELTARVEGEDAVELGGSYGGDASEGFDARVGDYDVDVLEVGAGGGEEAGDVVGLGYVGGDGNGSLAEGFDLFDYLDDGSQYYLTGSWEGKCPTPFISSRY